MVVLPPLKSQPQNDDGYYYVPLLYSVIRCVVLKSQKTAKNKKEEFIEVRLEIESSERLVYEHMASVPKK